MMNSKEREHLDRLIRRRDWLEGRIAELEAAGREASYDVAEHSALNWAIGIVTEQLDEPIEKPAPKHFEKDATHCRIEPGELAGKVASSYSIIQEHCVEQLRNLDLPDPIRFTVETGDHLAQTEIRRISRGPFGFEIELDLRKLTITATPKIFDKPV